MRVREFAKHIGVTHPAVLKACAIGRLNRSVTRDKQGRVVDIDPELGAAEWAQKGRMSLAEMRGTRRAVPAAPPPSLAEGSPRLELHGLEQIDRAGGPTLAIRFPLDGFVAGAAKALRSAGKEPTREALRAIVESRSAEAWWLTAFGAFDSAIRGERSGDEIAESWEAEGREAVLGEAREGSDRGDA